MSKKQRKQQEENLQSQYNDYREEDVRILKKKTTATTNKKRIYQNKWSLFSQICRALLFILCMLFVKKFSLLIVCSILSPPIYSLLYRKKIRISFFL